MANISVSEADFGLVFDAAHRAKADGDDAAAALLDKLARRINVALSASKAPTIGMPRRRYTWRDAPSVFDPHEGEAA